VIDIQPEIISQERPAQKALESDRMAKLIKAAETSEELASYQSQTPPELYDLFDSRVIELKEAGK
jgi:hypothetical protein